MLCMELKLLVYDYCHSYITIILSDSEMCAGLMLKSLYILWIHTDTPMAHGDALCLCVILAQQLSRQLNGAPPSSSPHDHDHHLLIHSHDDFASIHKS